ncbi:MAG: UDP-glucose/GDP-mannose dehydrogenase family protein [Proteobacteria bacterium]|nr:UDP-glucose/GDP-mannose dehydrogenase family protein [Pseudomonadota bacterium]
MKITVVGTGYVGLVSGACLAEMGHHVICVDTDKAKIDKLKQGGIPIYEYGLEGLVVENIRHNRLEFTTDISQGVKHGQIIFIAVGTPPDEDGSADLKYVLQVADSIGQSMNDYRVVVTKSTVPVGTAEKVRATLRAALDKRGTNIEFSVASNPEFLKEGAAVEDFMKPDRIVIGTDDERASELLKKLYAPFNRNHERVIFMDIPSAELTKYAANSMLATKISFMNEVANLAELLGADIESVRKGIGSDPRVGYHFIYPGCGYGGSCFPKDVQALARTAAGNGYEMRILNAVEAVNDDQKFKPVEKLVSELGEDLNGKTIALWGLAFKPDTDDMREAPSRVVINELLSRGAKIAAFDPVAYEEAERIFAGEKNLSIHHDDPYKVLIDAEALIVVTEWKMFRGVQLSRVREEMKGNLIIDGRNIFSPGVVREHGMIYHGIGRV